MRWALMIALMMACSPMWAQDTDAVPLFSANAAPATMRLKDLTAEWRRVSLSTPDSHKGDMSDQLTSLLPLALMSDSGKGKGEVMQTIAGLAMLSAMSGGGLGGSRETIYYTQGRTIALASETFLVTYTPVRKRLDPQEMMASAGASGGEPDLAKLLGGERLTPETELVLCLLNVRTISTIGGIRPFDMAREIEESGKANIGLLQWLGVSRTVEAQKPAPDGRVKTAPASPRSKPR